MARGWACGTVSTMQVVRRHLDDVQVAGPRSAPRRLDFLLVLLVVASGIADVAFGGFPLWPGHLVVAAIAAAMLPFRRRFPIETTIFVFLCQLGLETILLAQDHSATTTVAFDLASIFFVYALCRWPEPQRAGLGFAITMAVVLVIAARRDNSAIEALGELVPWVMLALLALAMRYRARLMDQRALDIRLAERNALARELHDSVAHHISAIAVQAQAAQFIAASDPAGAMAAVRTIEEIANRSIDEMRRMVGILRSDADHAVTVSAGTLLGFADPGGIPKVTVIGQSDLTALPPSVAAAVYRITQEAITNAKRHSRQITFIDVELAIHEDSVVIDIINDGQPSHRGGGGGFGLIGMNERVAALGGTIETGPRPSSGWRVRATIPLTRVSRPA